MFPGKRREEERTIGGRGYIKKYNSYYRLACSCVHNEVDAEDIVQSMAYNALRASRTLKNPEFVETWLYRILMNEIFRMLKKPEDISYEEYIEKTGNEGEHVEDTYEDVDLMQVIDSLSVKDKLVVELRFFEDRKLEDIALILEENVNTIKSRLYRSLKKMRIMLEE